MRTDLVCEPGTPTRLNEDFAALALPASGQGGSLVVLDGVTPPEGDYGCRHSVPWFCSQLGGTLTQLSVSRRDLPLSETLSAALLRVTEAHETTCDLSHPRTPQATVVLARWDERTVEYLVLSDSALLYETADGAVVPVLDDRIARLPRSALATHAEVDATLRNKEGGFFTAAADPSVASRAVTGTLPREEVRTLLALTDGATRWTEMFQEGDWDDLFAVVRKEGAQSLVDRVRTLERADEGERLRLRRGKTHDDATVAYVEL
ncbi:hypothetical protein OK074_5606 [Actinobacteria bacterium OK074]|nr:hypothetical protein OK074_5606 [Actinobacteria bacterium OK074]